MDERGPRTDEGWRALTSDLVAVVHRYAPGWTDITDGDPGIVLVNLFAWLADALEYRDGMIGEGSLGTRRRLGVIAHHVLSDASPVVTVDGIRWRPTPS